MLPFFVNCVLKWWALHSTAAKYVEKSSDRMRIASLDPGKMSDRDKNSLDFGWIKLPSYKFDGDD